MSNEPTSDQPESTGETPTDGPEIDTPVDETPIDETPVDDTPDTSAPFGGHDAGGEGESGYVPRQAPPPPVSGAPVRRLVRDPYSRLGGVASGIAHHTGIDVSLVRLGFVVTTLFTGVGLILYLLAWLIVPRAEYWPPAPYQSRTPGDSILGGRELAYGLLAIGILMAVFAGGGGAARMLISIGLVGAGIWLLVQPSAGSPATSPDPSAAPTPPSTPSDVPGTWQPASGDDTMTSSYSGVAVGEGESGSVAAPAAPTGPAAPTTVYVPSPVPPRRRRIWPFLLIIGLLAIPLLAAAVAIPVFFIATDGDLNDTDITVTPAEVGDIPTTIDGGAGTITLDLSQLTADDFDAVTDKPQEIEIDLNAGEITVVVPDDLAVSVDASAGAGDVTVFDDSEDGIRPRVDVSAEDPVLELDVRVGVGEVTVER